MQMQSKTYNTTLVGKETWMFLCVHETSLGEAEGKKLWVDGGMNQRLAGGEMRSLYLEKYISI